MALIDIDRIVPRLAVRKGIAWGTDAPTEDSDVLHICLPSGHFTDIRFPISGKNGCGPLWTFAGHSTFRKIPALAPSDIAIHQGWYQIVRGQFAHPIDSTGNFVDDYHSDIVDLSSGNGDQMETGMLGNPDTGAFIHYKEYWTLKQAISYPCVRAVFEKEGDGHGLLKGQMIRVGETIQGVRQVKEKECEAGQWTLVKEDWQIDPRSVDTAAASFPHHWLSQERRVGDKIEHAGRQWRVVEAVSG
ncbi:uncharacterized protein I303_102403 [Kwoniella dejecticola CBS 10117]|uniref:Protein HRI1 n=1 Tax=Kwoniella dejecticola CBS 10117 TaxID=1296121 RepID=A0A1A6A8M9_9TREE|nr:uncharacterized protein I303_02417 [Kwoniella dejecticola CBS 10117]OBR86410.1 hypothetical protein I303_02417 [Kwoniella dejecticola CBS 10117]